MGALARAESGSFHKTLSNRCITLASDPEQLGTRSIGGLSGGITSAGIQLAACSEVHSMRGVVLGERESGANVLLHELVLDVAEESGVNSLLQSLAGIRGRRLGGLIGKELGRLGRLLSLLLGEGLVSDLGGVDALEVDLGAGGDGVHLVDASHRHTVELEGTSDGEETGLQVLEEHDSLASESTSEEDEDGAGRDRLAELGGLGLEPLRGRLGIFGGVPLSFLNHVKQ